MQSKVLGIDVNKERNISIDLLRIVLMFLIIVGHIFAHTHIRTTLPLFSGKWLFTWGLQALTVCAVNCFILITGYFMSSRTFKSSHVLKLWFKTFIYSMLVGNLFWILKLAPFSVKGFIGNVFPVLSQVWWFISCYILLYFLAPFINAGLNSLTKKQFNCLMLLNVIVFYCLPIFAMFFIPFDLTEGMGIIGFVTLYITGAYLAKSNFNISLKWCFIWLIINNAVILISKILLTLITQKYNIEAGTALFYHNNTIFEIFNAVLLFLIFKQIKITNLSKIIMFFSSSVFAVYLIHEQPLMRNLLWQTGLKQVLLDCSMLSYIGLIVSIPIGIFLSSVLIDKFLNLILFTPFYNSKLIKNLESKLIKIDIYFNGGNI